MSSKYSFHRILAANSVAILILHQTSPPWLVLKIPGDCFEQARIQRLSRHITKLTTDTIRIDRVTTVMARPIGNEIDQGCVFLPVRGRTIRETFPQSFILRKELVYQKANLCDDLDVTTLIATTNVVGFAGEVDDGIETVLSH